ncbi:glycosyltransferase family 2 protein [Aggregicoccus sp. 17bor-14]|uniref:glycosyltransferase family 2 protein n=1 Tax=Myxococcaceae TaxID=31 RepID=UPI00129C662B|nr:MULTISPECIES: glycosyltransferase family 2 protein [Myxococcaceae]MBF5042768.1 glycosyltransferase family 2 protein [Simulacricoccus sp. 17bor-14]MRI88536.1 glycosyltransferase family 2 protein [Aggregicoccus sp. 17bor-14]
MPQLTIGLPVFNAMPYLAETVRSLLGQSFRDFELLAIDDGSTDGSGEFLSKIEDPRIRLIRQPNRGLTGTLNRMLEEARTPWLVRHDADDVAYPQRLQRIMEAITSRPDSGMFYSPADYTGAGRSLGTFRTSRGSPAQLTLATRAGYLLAICHPTVTLNVKKTVALGGYRFDLHIEDIDLWWRMALRHEITLIPEPTVGFRLNTGSVSSSNLERQERNMLFVQHLLLSHLWQLSPSTLEQAAPALDRLMDPKKLLFRRHLRAAGMAMGERAYGKALLNGGLAAVKTPTYLLKRLAYGRGEDASMAVNGVSPLEFAAISEKLWPSRGASAMPEARR